MRNLYLILLVSTLYNCDSRKDSLEFFNDAPLFITESDTITMLSDSVKLSLGSYVFDVSGVDPNNNLSSLNIEVLQGDGNFRINNQLIESGSESSFNGSVDRITYDPNFTGRHEGIITLTDAFDLSVLFEYELVVFNNISPVAIVSIVKPSGSGPFERLIDASGSFDGDVNFGGRIVEYEYSFLGILRNIDSDSQTVIFPSSGNYQIVVRVLDNDGEWSEPVGTNVEV